MHALESLRSLHFQGSTLEAFCLRVVENERTDGSVRADECTLITLDTVLRIPYRNHGLNATLLVGCCSVLPCAVDCTVLYEVADLQKVTSLCVHRTDKLLNECWSVVFLLVVVRQVSPCRVNGKFLVLTASVNGSVVHVDDILTLLTVRLDDELLHLLNGQIFRDNLRYAEECRLQNGVSAVAQSNLTANLAGVDVVYCYVVLCEVLLDVVRNEVNELFTVEDGVEQECTIVAKTTSYIVHVEVSLYVASHEVRRIYEVSGVDRLITEAQVRACEATRLLGIVGEISLTVLVGVVTNNLHGVFVGTYSTVGTESEELSLEE